MVKNQSVNEVFYTKSMQQISTRENLFGGSVALILNSIHFIPDTARYTMSKLDGDLPDSFNENDT